MHFAFAREQQSELVAATYKVAGATVLLDQPRTELVLDSRWLDMPIIPDEPRMLRYLDAFPAPLVVSFRDELSYTERVQSVLRQHLERSPWMSLERP